MSVFTETYTAYKATRKPSLKGNIRNFALNVLSSLANEKHLSRPRVQILYIHHLFADEEKNFTELLKWLSRHHTFISYSDAVEKILSGNIDKPYIAFSSDDGFKNNLRAAAILKEFGASVCFFVNPGIIGVTDIQVLKKHCDEVLRFPLVEFLNWEDVAYLISQGHEIGSHTMLHTDITQVPSEKVYEDISKTLNILNSRCGTVKHFAYPYGRFFHINRSGFETVLNLGFRSCASAERGCHISNGMPVNPQNLLLRRDHIVLGWNINHIKYFIINNAKKASVDNNALPPL